MKPGDGFGGITDEEIDSINDDFHEFPLPFGKSERGGNIPSQGPNHPTEDSTDTIDG